MEKIKIGDFLEEKQNQEEVNVSKTSFNVSDISKLTEVEDDEEEKRNKNFENLKNLNDISITYSNFRGDSYID